MAKYGTGKNNIPQAGRFGAQSEVAFAGAVAGGHALQAVFVAHRGGVLELDPAVHLFSQQTASQPKESWSLVIMV